MLHDSRFLAKCEKISFILLCVVMGYACFAGTASFLSIGPITLWQVAVVGMVLATVPLILVHHKKLISNCFLWILVAFGLWLCISALIGWRSGHKTALVLRDVKSYAYFVLFPFVWAAMKNKAQLRTLMRVMMYACLGLGIVTIVSMALYVWAPLASNKWIRFCRLYGFLNFTPISAKIGRFLFVTTPFQLFGCAIPLYFQVTGEKRSWHLPVISAVCLFAVLLSYTRTLYLSAGVAVLLLAVAMLLSVEKKKWGRILMHLGLAVVILAVLVGGFSLAAKTDYFGYALDRVFVSGDENTATEPTDVGVTDSTLEIPEFETAEEYLEATKVSDQIRARLEENLWKQIRSTPIFGAGLGLSIEGRETPPELFFLDLWAKTGILGLALYLLPYLLSVLYVVVNLWRKQQNLSFTVWAVCLAGLMVYSLFQPYANNAPSILVYCCFLQIPAMKKAELAEAEENTKENEP